MFLQFPKLILRLCFSMAICFIINDFYECDCLAYLNVRLYQYFFLINKKSTRKVSTEKLNVLGESVN